MYVIAGVSGRTGSIVATTLLAAGKPVRVIVRDAAKGAPWKAKGADVAVASIDDRAALARALTGAEGAYLLLPPPAWNQTELAAERKRHVDALVGAVADARPGHVVLLSSVGANHPAGTGPIAHIYSVEKGLTAAGVKATFLRAAFFQENWGSMAAGAIASGSLYYGISEGVRFAQVATEDIGKTAARLLLAGPPAASPRIVELAGPADHTLAETAQLLAKVSGKPVQGVSIPPSAQVEALVGMGASRDLAASFGEMSDAMNTGKLTWQGTDVVRGTVGLEQTLRQLVG